MKAPPITIFAPTGRVPPAVAALKRAWDGDAPLQVVEVKGLGEVDPGEGPALLLLDRDLLPGKGSADALRALPLPVAVVSLDPGARRSALTAGRHFLSLADEDRDEAVLRSLRAALEHAVALSGAHQAREALDRTRVELRELNRVGMALMSERDPDRLLELILTQARRLTTSDAGSLYLVEGGDEEGDEPHLHFRMAQNDSLGDLPNPDFTIPINQASIAGYVASTGEVLVLKDAYAIPKKAPYTFNRGFDEEYGYRAKSMLAVPMMDHKDRIVGVLQLINRKRTEEGEIRSEEDADREVLLYGERDVELVRSLAGQAAVSIENGQLYRSIEELFEGFIKAAVTAIDQRDPTTSGHSVRVATLTCDLAEYVDRSSAAPFRDVRFSREQMKELRYAGLLHDFGKVGVREEVLVKSKKLPPVMLERIEARFDLIRRTLESEFHRKRAELLLGRDRDEAVQQFQAMERELAEEFERLDRFQQAVREANEPRVLPEDAEAALPDIAKHRFPDFKGKLVPYLTPDELHFLSIPKGSLDLEERKQIESHVIHTYHFLLQIPWTEELARVGEIAKGHHEKLDGSGYPYGLKADDIPIQTRLMTVSDIFDALTASDRPYKRALAADRAISILEMEAKAGQLDKNVVKLLIESKVFERIVEEDWRQF
jgi:HD-GYP domain-containing protein (c-di-GMP phosphodiesterase class II)